MSTTRRAFTLIEVIIATTITTMIAATVIALIDGLTGALAIQDLRSEAIVRGAGVQSHIGLLSLKTRMTLALSEQRVLLWLPAETLAESGSGSDSAFDRIDLVDDELHWLEFAQEADLTWSLIEWSVKPEAVPAGESEVYFSTDATFWDDLFVQLRDTAQLRRSPIAVNLAPPLADGVVAAAPRFVWQSSNCCENHSIGAEFAFVALEGEAELRSDMRMESALAFFDRHPICSESGS